MQVILNSINCLYNWLEQSKIAIISAVLLSLFLIARWYYFVNTYSVNVLFYDQWDFLNGLFYSDGLLDLYLYQHGPHRQGIGMWLIAFVNYLSDWNTQVDANLVASFSFISGISFLLLKQKITGKRSFFDIIILLICLSPLQHGVFSNTPNVSHGTLPLFLISLYGWSIFIKHKLKRYALILVLDMLLIYTGFGFFMGLIIPAYFIVEWIKESNKKEQFKILVALTLSLLFLASFFIDYSLQHFNESVLIENPNSIDYMLFILFGLSRIIGSVFSFNTAIIIGAVGIVFICYSYYRLTKKLYFLHHESKDYKVAILCFSLSLFTISYFIVTSIGRTKYGIETAISTRYFPLLIPLYISLYYFICIYIKKNQVALLISLFITSFSSFYYPAEIRLMKEFKAMKTNWVTVYLESGNSEMANKCEDCLIYPKDIFKAANIDEKIDYLKKNDLNLFIQQNN